MDFEKIFIKNANPTKIGGQAVLEGLMMRGETKMAISIRTESGEIVTEVEEVQAKKSFAKIPIFRGIWAFGSALIGGIKVLMRSVEMIEEQDGVSEKGNFELWIEKKFGKKTGNSIIMYFSLVLALAFSIGIFVLAPTASTGLLKHISTNPIILNLIEGLFRIVLFVLYVVLISRSKDIKKVFQYHGAEHKTIHCFENGLELTPENCQSFSTLHPRCGTSFMMFVMVISLVLFSLLGWPNLIFRLLSRLLLIPIIAGLSYELLRWAGRSDATMVKILSYPGLLLQKLTTAEPDDKQVEVAIEALKAVK